MVYAVGQQPIYPYLSESLPRGVGVGVGGSWRIWENVLQQKRTENWRTRKSNFLRNKQNKATRKPFCWHVYFFETLQFLFMTTPTGNRTNVRCVKTCQRIIVIQNKDRPRRKRICYIMFSAKNNRWEIINIWEVYPVRYIKKRRWFSNNYGYRSGQSRKAILSTIWDKNLG